jgi:ribonuclease P protein component
MNGKLGKPYKLCSQKTIAQLFKEGGSVRHYPFMVQFMDSETGTGKPFQLVFSAPKRTFRRAHDRNRIKRLMREAFRKKKLILEEALSADNKQLALFVIYTAKEEIPHDVLLKKAQTLLEKLTQEIQNEKDPI